MNYALLREIRTIDIVKPPLDNMADISRKTLARRIASGYEAAKRSLEERPLSV